MLSNLLLDLLRNNEIVVIFMPFFFAQSMLSFGQYEINSSEATRFWGSILMRFELLEPPLFPLHAFQFAFKSVEKKGFCDRLKSL